MIREIELQTFLFENNPSRVELLNYQAASCNKFTVSVYRNHSFELVENTIHAYLDYADIKVNFSYSDYDDSLSFLNLDLSCDLIILWLDISRYKNINIDAFLNSRIRHLKVIFKKNILAIPFENNFRLSCDNVICYDTSYVKSLLGEQYKDERLEKFSGTKMSLSTCSVISEDLGLNYIPAILRPALKCIVVDLDNTLYHGVLGEDGAENLTLTPYHKQLQEKLKFLSCQGFFLCIASKNNVDDVIELFSVRDDFPLKFDDFTKICANWSCKSTSISEIINELNINENSVLFIDDNIGEIFSVKSEYPSIKVILANMNAEITKKVLSNFPGLLKLSLQKEDGIRKGDSLANKSRKIMLHSFTREDYLKDLNVELSFSLHCKDYIGRIAELANKTNQFIFTYKRYSLSEVAALLENDKVKVVAVFLKDRLSDSGLIGVVVVRQGAHGAILEECFVSCRSLGRGLDKEIVLGAINVALKKLSVSKLQVNLVIGKRNKPACSFIDDFLAKHKGCYSDFEFNFANNLLKVNLIGV